MPNNNVIPINRGKQTNRINRPHNHNVSEETSDTVVSGALSYLLESMSKIGINVDTFKSDKDIAMVVYSIESLMSKNTNRYHPLHKVTEDLFTDRNNELIMV